MWLKGADILFLLLLASGAASVSAGLYFANTLTISVLYRRKWPARIWRTAIAVAATYALILACFALAFDQPSYVFSTMIFIIFSAMFPAAWRAARKRPQPEHASFLIDGDPDTYTRINQFMAKSWHYKVHLERRGGMKAVFLALPKASPPFEPGFLLEYPAGDGQPGIRLTCFASYDYSRRQLYYDALVLKDHDFPVDLEQARHQIEIDEVDAESVLQGYRQDKAAMEESQTRDQTGRSGR